MMDDIQDADLDILETQRFEIKNSLMEFTGRVLTPDTIDAICEKVNGAIERGPCSWAFRQGYEKRDSA